MTVFSHVDGHGGRQIRPRCLNLLSLLIDVFLFAYILQGHRLGTAAERVDAKPDKEQMNRDDATNTPAPVVDDNLTEEERAKIRADRAKAAEARLKQVTGKKKKKKTTDAAPLRGPNTEPLMRWN